MSAPATPETLRGIVLVILSASVFAGVDGISKVLAETQSVGQIVWARYAIALPTILLLTPRAEWREIFHTAHPRHQILRGIAPMGVSITMVLAVRYLPLAEATVILFAAPFLVVALAGPLLGERVHPASWVGVVIGFASLALVVRPGFGEVSYHVLFPLAAAVFYALYQIVTRGLATKGEPPRAMLAWTLATGTVVATPLALLSWEPVSSTAWIAMISLGLVFGLAQFLMIQAYVHAPAGVLAPFAYAQIIAATLIGIVFFGAVPDIWTLLGVLMMIGAGIWLTRSQRAGRA